MLDAYVLGAIPPYSFLLGGKAVACLIRSRDVFADFQAKYGGSGGVLSEVEKSANPLAVTYDFVDAPVVSLQPPAPGQ